jgi:hypothetical protein
MNGGISSGAKKTKRLVLISASEYPSYPGGLTYMAPFISINNINSCIFIEK